MNELNFSALQLMLKTTFRTVIFGDEIMAVSDKVIRRFHYLNIFFKSFRFFTQGQIFQQEIGPTPLIVGPLGSTKNSTAPSTLRSAYIARVVIRSDTCRQQSNGLLQGQLVGTSSMNSLAPKPFRLRRRRRRIM